MTRYASGRRAEWRARDWITDPRLQTLTLNERWPRFDLENSRRDRLTEIVVALAQEVA